MVLFLELQFRCEAGGKQDKLPLATSLSLVGAHLVGKRKRMNPEEFGRQGGKVGRTEIG